MAQVNIPALPVHGLTAAASGQAAQVQGSPDAAADFMLALTFLKAADIPFEKAAVPTPGLIAEDDEAPEPETAPEAEPDVSFRPVISPSPAWFQSVTSQQAGPEQPETPHKGDIGDPLQRDREWALAFGTKGFQPADRVVAPLLGPADPDAQFVTPWPHPETQATAKQGARGDNLPLPWPRPAASQSATGPQGVEGVEPRATRDPEPPDLAVPDPRPAPAEPAAGDVARSRAADLLPLGAAGRITNAFIETAQSVQPAPRFLADGGPAGLQPVAADVEGLSSGGSSDRALPAGERAFEQSIPHQVSLAKQGKMSQARPAVQAPLPVVPAKVVADPMVTSELSPARPLAQGQAAPLSPEQSDWHKVPAPQVLPGAAASRMPTLDTKVTERPSAAITEAPGAEDPLPLANTVPLPLRAARQDESVPLSAALPARPDSATARQPGFVRAAAGAVLAPLSPQAVPIDLASSDNRATAEGFTLPQPTVFQEKAPRPVADPPTLPRGAPVPEITTGMPVTPARSLASDPLADDTQRIAVTVIPPIEAGHSRTAPPGETGLRALAEVPPRSAPAAAPTPGLVPVSAAGFREDPGGLHATLTTGQEPGSETDVRLPPATLVETDTRGMMPPPVRTGPVRSTEGPRATGDTDRARRTVAQVVTALREAEPGVTELRLDPAHLGRVRIVLRTEGQVAVVHLLAERQETLEVLRRSSPELSAGLEQQGFERPKFSFGQDRQAPQPEFEAHPPPDAAPVPGFVAISQVRPDRDLDLRL